MSQLKISQIKLTPLLNTLELKKISDVDYFSNTYSKYISNSRLSLLYDGNKINPESFFEGFKSGGFNQSFMLGTAVHSICLQNEYFEIAEDVGKPTAKLGAMADELFNVFAQREVTIADVIKASDKIDYYKGKIDNKRFAEVIEKCTPYWESRQKYELNLSQDKEILYLDTKSREIALSCIDAINNNKSAQALLHPQGICEDPISENEQAILLDVEAEMPNGKKVILHLKSKLDNYTIDKETNTICVNDIKTIGKIVSEMDSNIKRFHYSRELGMYSYLLKLCAEKFYGLTNPKIQANYLVVSTVPNFYSKVRPATYKELVDGFKEFTALLKYSAYLMCYKGYSFDEQPSKYAF